MDETDKMIVSILQEDGRASLIDIGRKLGLSHVSVRKRLKKLCDKIIQITTGLNIEELGFHIAIINAEVEGYDRLLKFIEKFSRCPRMVFMTTTTGSYNLMTIMVAEDSDTLKAIIEVCSVRAQKGIRRSEVTIGDPPIIPKYLPVRIVVNKNLEEAPCGVNCGKCVRYNQGKCLACPATKYYRGPL